jgi:hypothetical protein
MGEREGSQRAWKFGFRSSLHLEALIPGRSQQIVEDGLGRRTDGTCDLAQNTLRKAGGPGCRSAGLLTVNVSNPLVRAALPLRVNRVIFFASRQRPLTLRHSP